MKRPLLALPIIMLLLVPPYVRTVIEARAFILRAERAKAEGDREKSAEYYTEAVRWRAPFNAYAERAYFAARDIISGVEDPRLRAGLLEELKSALLASRGFVTGAGDSTRLEEIEKQLQQLGMARTARLELVHPPRLNFSWQIAAQFAFWSWVTSVLATIWCGFTPRGEPLRATLSRGIAFCAIFYALWLFSLAQA